MKNVLLAGVGLAVLSVAATAADLPSRTRQPVAPVVAAAPAFTWTGLYAGVNAGYGWSSEEKLGYVGDAASLAYAGSGVYPWGLSNKRSGFVGGGQLGANYQMGRFVAGIETDLQSIGASKRSSYLLASGSYGSFKSSTNWLGTTRIRLGVTPVDRLLVYGTGGVAYGSVKHYGDIVAPSLGGAQWFGRHSDTKFGWALGAGAEYAFTNNLTAKLEYLYYDLGKSNLALAAANAPAAALGNRPLQRNENRGSIVRAGLNYKF
jgi:outer membrane immunogenic protein